MNCGSGFLQELLNSVGKIERARRRSISKPQRPPGNNCYGRGHGIEQITLARGEVRRAEQTEESIWGKDFSQSDVFARNISMDYFALAIEMAIGVLMLPFN